MKTTILADYKAKTSTGSRIHVAHNNLPLLVNQMIVWMMNNPEIALGMVPRWGELKADQQAFADHAEAEPAFTAQQVADACMAAEIPDSKCESLLLALRA